MSISSIAVLVCLIVDTRLPAPVGPLVIKGEATVTRAKEKLRVIPGRFTAREGDIFAIGKESQGTLFIRASGKRYQLKPLSKFQVLKNGAKWLSGPAFSYTVWTMGSKDPTHSKRVRLASTIRGGDRGIGPLGAVRQGPIVLKWLPDPAASKLSLELLNLDGKLLKAFPLDASATSLDIGSDVFPAGTWARARLVIRYASSPTTSRETLVRVLPPTEVARLKLGEAELLRQQKDLGDEYEWARAELFASYGLVSEMEAAWRSGSSSLKVSEDSSAAQRVLGEWYESAGFPTEALAAYVKARQAGDSDEDLEEAILRLGGRAQTEVDRLEVKRDRLVAQGINQDALLVAQQIVSILRENKGDPLRFGKSLTAVGLIQTALRQFEPAQRVLDEAVRVLEASSSPNSMPIVLALDAHARLAYSRSDLANAQRFWERSLVIFEKLAPGTLGVASSLNSLGVVTFARGRMDEAQGYYERSLAIREKLAPGSLLLASSLGNLGLVAFARGQLDEAQDYNERSLAISMKLAPGSLNVASSLGNLGLVAHARGRLEEAHGYHERSLDIFEKLAPGSLNVASSLGNLGLVAYARRRMDEAQGYYERSLVIREKLAPGSQNVAVSLYNLGNVAFDRGRLDEAQDYFERTLAIDEKVAPVSMNLASSLLNLGNIASKRGRLDEAQRYYERSLAIRDKLAPGSIAVANTLNNFGHVAFARGRLDEAEGYYERSRAIFEKLDPLSLSVASSLVSLGNIASKLGRLEAQRYYESALAIIEKLAPGSLIAASTLQNLGHAAFDHERLDEAQAHYGRSLDIFEELSPRSLEVAASLHNLGRIAYARGRLDEAQGFYERSLVIAEKLAPGSLDVARSLGNLGKVARKQGALPELLRLWTQQAALARESLARETGSQGGDTGAFGVQSGYVLARAGWLERPEKSYQWLPTLRAAGFTLRVRARAFEMAAEAFTEIAAARSDVQMTMKSEADWVTNPRTQERTEKDWDDKLFDLRRTRQAAELRLSGLLKEKNPNLGQDLKVETAQVQAAIPKDHVLVEFLRVGTWDDKQNKEGPDAYAAFIVGPSGPVKYVRLANAEEVDQGVMDFMAKLDLESPGKEDEKTRVALGKKLYQMLIAPLGKLPNNVLLAPDQALHSLAFGALQDKQGRYLIETKVISLVGSGRDLVFKAPTAPAGDAVVMGVGFFDANMDRHGQAVKSVTAKLIEGTTADRGNSPGAKWGPLPSAEYEADTVAKKLGVSPIIGEEAIQERFLSIKNPKVLHLATHGFFYPPAVEPPKTDRLMLMGMGERISYADNPMLRSGIILAGANDEDKLREAKFLSGWVTALDISTLDLRGTELVVLSACNTGRGEVKLSEGVFGLQRAFRFAGAQTLIMSLIKVPDDSTQQLMASFYGEWKPGMPPGSKLQALRNAQLKLLKDPKTRHPKNWAGFVLMGDR